MNMPRTTQQSEFYALQARLAALHTSRRPAIAVSGGADSLCLALITRDWCAATGEPLALIVDHGLRAASSHEAKITADRLATLGIPARILTLHNLAPGPGLAARARAARYDALFAATRESGRIDLLLGHHRADQAETLLMRRASHSAPPGLAAMPSIREMPDVRVLRPLLGAAPATLRAILTEAGIGWIEDPSNRDLTTQRARLRAGLDDPGGDGPATRALAEEAAAFGAARAELDRAAAAELAARASLHPEGYAVLSPGPIGAPALSALIRMLGGAPFPPASAAIARIAADPRPCVLAGVRLLPAGRLGPADRLGPGLLLVREPAAMAAPQAARAGTLWDRRFRVQSAAGDGQIGALGADAAGLRRHSPLPDAVLRTLPALRVHGVLADVPHIGYRPGSGSAHMAVCFAPASPAAGAAFGV
jgi:tRNA(Ile)-lysidine synthase